MTTTKSKDHVAIDIDDVTLNFWPGIAEAFTREYNIEVPAVHPWSADAVAFGKHELFRASGYSDWWDWLRENDHLWAKVFTPVPGAIGGIRRLRAADWYVEAVTSRPRWAEWTVNAFIGRYRIPFQRVTIVAPGQSKVDFTDATVVIDDKLATCVDFNKASRSAVLFDRIGGHTDDPALSPFLRQARDWEDVIAIMEGFRV